MQESAIAVLLCKA